MVIVHILYPIQFSTFIRCILSIKDAQTDYHLLLPIGYKPYQSLIESRFSSYIVFHWIKSEQDLFETVNKINPTAILLSISPHASFVNKLFSNVSCRQIYYQHHGFFVNNPNIYNLASSGWSKLINYIVGDINAYTAISRFAPNKVKHFPGLPQIDYILNNIERIKSQYQNVPTFLIANGSSYNYSNNIKILDSIVKYILSVFPDSFIFLKVKTPYYSIRSKYIKSLSNITIIDPKELIYEYFFTDYNIIIEGGSVFLESLLINKKTILYQNYNQNDYYEIKDKPDMMISKTDSQFLSFLNNFKHNSNLDKHVEQAELYIYETIGEVKPISDNITDYLLAKH